VSGKPASATVFEATAGLRLRCDLKAVVIENREMQARGFEQHGEVADAR
jgi:hypothetical protein